MGLPFCLQLDFIKTHLTLKPLNYDRGYKYVDAAQDNTLLLSVYLYNFIVGC